MHHAKQTPDEDVKLDRITPDNWEMVTKIKSILKPFYEITKRLKEMQLNFLISDPLDWWRRHQQIYPNLSRMEFDLLVAPLLRGDLISLEVLWKRVSVCDLGYQLVLYGSRQLKNNTALLRNLAPLMLPI